MRDATITARYFHLTGLSSARTRLRRTAHYRAFLRALDAGLNAHPVRVLSYCLLPDAWHIVVGPTGPGRLKALLQRVAATQSDPAPLPVVARPLRTGSELIGHCVAVERRPVAMGLVRYAQDWPWCSSAERFRLTSRVPLVSTRILTSQAWLDHLNAPRPSDVLRRVAPSDFSQMPGLLARRFERVEHRVSMGGGAHEDHADAHVEGAKHLGVGNAAGLLQPRKQRRYRPAVPIE